MTDLKTQRNPILPTIPTKEEWDKFPRIEQWRRSQLTVVKDLHASVYDDLSNVANDAANAANDAANAANLANIASLAVAYTIPCHELYVRTGTWPITADVNQVFGGYRYNTSNANGDSLQCVRRYTPAGTYYVHLFGYKTTDSGIAKIYFHGGANVTIDMYGSSNLYNYNPWAANLIKSLSSNANLYIDVDGQNANSSGFRLYVSQVVLVRVS